LHFLAVSAHWKRLNGFAAKHCVNATSQLTGAGVAATAQVVRSFVHLVRSSTLRAAATQVAAV
jgi:hypothetical protein